MFADFYTSLIGLETARPLIEADHYLHSVPTGRNIFFGAFLADGELYAVADYGPGSNNNLEKFLARFTEAPITRDNLMVLKRLVRKGERGNAQISTAKFLVNCHATLREFFGVRYIMAYSDPAAGHTGAIYKGLGFLNFGRTPPQQHCIDADGKLWHDRGINHRVRRSGLTAPEVRAMLGLKLVMTPAKDRWFLPLQYGPDETLIRYVLAILP